MNASYLFSHAESREQRDAAMESVARNADETVPHWGDMAFDWIKVYAKAHREFISESCTAAALAAGIPAPHDDRAWGPIFARASRQKIIARIGYGTSTRRHLSPTPLWESQTFGR